MRKFSIMEYVKDNVRIYFRKREEKKKSIKQRIRILLGSKMNR